MGHENLSKQEDAKLAIGGVSGNINVTKATRVNHVNISTNITWFHDSQIIVRDDGEKLIFKKPTIAYKGRSYTTSPTQCGWVCFSIKSEIPTGHYQISDESDEDNLVLYYR